VKIRRLITLFGIHGRVYIFNRHLVFVGLALRYEKRNDLWATYSHKYGAKFFDLKKDTRHERP
jgi:hypothetical protein